MHGIGVPVNDNTKLVSYTTLHASGCFSYSVSLTDLLSHILMCDSRSVSETSLFSEAKQSSTTVQLINHSNYTTRTMIMMN
jgi:hypothetical protein